MLKQALRLSNGLEMPRIGLGTGMLNNAKAIENAIVNVGYRNIDAASIMQNEKVVGKAINKAIDSGAVSREDLFVASKLWHSSYDDPEQALDQSLAKLGLDYLDMYYVHWPNALFTQSKLPMHEIWQSMEMLIYSGKVRSLAISNFNLAMTADLLTYAHVKPVCNQICLNPQCAQEDLVRFLLDQEVIPVAYSPLGRVGSKSGPVGTDITGDSLLGELAQKYGKTPSQVILNWGLSRGYCIIPKAQQEAHQAENFAAQDFELEPQEVKAITEKFDERKYLYLHTHDSEYNVFA